MVPSCSPVTAVERSRLRTLALLTVLVVCIGLAWRLTRYLLAFPIWGDEVMLLINYYDRSYLDIFGPIDYCQIAPLLFHWAELAVWHTLGTSELALRLPALIASLAAVALLGWLAYLTLPSPGRHLAVAIFAVSIWPATMGSLCKPYAFDLLFGVALLLPLAYWLRQPDRPLPLLLLCLMVPVAVCSSYPVVFVAGGISVALLPTLWQRRGQPGWAGSLGLALLYNLLLVSSFALHYHFVGRAHLASPVNGVTTAVGMLNYWKDAFPPQEVLPFLRWLFLTHTGQMAAYPLGSANGGSALTALFALIGLVSWWRSGHRSLALVVLVSCGLWLAASWMHKYPYGGSCRLSQHVAGLYCLLAGGGIAALLSRCSPIQQHRWVCGILVVLALIGSGGIVRDFLRPYRDDEAQWGREVVQQLLQQVEGPIVVIGNPGCAPIDWYIRQHPDRFIWSNQVNWKQLATQHEELTVIAIQDLLLDERPLIGACLAGHKQSWQCQERSCYRLSVPLGYRMQECRRYRWVRQTSEVVEANR